MKRQIEVEQSVFVGRAGADPGDCCAAAAPDRGDALAT